MRDSLQALLLASKVNLIELLTSVPQEYSENWKTDLVISLKNS